MYCNICNRIVTKSNSRVIRVRPNTIHICKKCYGKAKKDVTKRLEDLINVEN